jgi:Ca2+-dependent lipid-binding protein
VKFLKSDDSINAHVELEIDGKVIGKTKSLDEKLPYFNETFYYIASSFEDLVCLNTFVATTMSSKLAGQAEFGLHELCKFPYNRNM